jgi:multicomponent Na+:H+ antiporter subunit D
LRTTAVRTHLVIAGLERVRAFIAGLARTHGPVGPLARSWPVGSMVLWVAIMLAASLIVYL